MQPWSLYAAAAASFRLANDLFKKTIFSTKSKQLFNMFVFGILYYAMACKTNSQGILDMGISCNFERAKIVAQLSLVLFVFSEHESRLVFGL